MRHRIGLWIVAACSLACFAARSESQNDNVTLLKHYLSERPCISRLLYSEIPVGASTLARTYVAGYCGDGYYMRELRAGDSEAKLSATNRMHSALFAGRQQDESWEINGVGVTVSIHPDQRNPDGCAVFCENQKNILQGVVALGSEHVKPGTFVWNGDTFQAVPSEFMRQMMPEKNHLEGEIKVNLGRIVEMRIKGSGLWEFEYEDSPKRPNWFPARVFALTPKRERREGWFIREIEFGNEANAAGEFLPEAHISSEVALLTVISNNQIVASPVHDPHAVQVVRQQISELAERHIRRSVIYIRITLALLTAATCGLILYLLAKKSQRNAADPDANL